jgi:mRNA (2'-O-methyladenosine-N6-)-methyltransferase
MSLGNQLNGVRLVDEGLRARFKAAYPDVEVQPASPPRASAMEVDSGPATHMRSPFTATDSKSAMQFTEPAAQ